MRLVADCFGTPNGLVFPVGEQQLPASDTREGFIRSSACGTTGTLSDGEISAEARAGEATRFDNIRFDGGGRL